MLRLSTRHQIELHGLHPCIWIECYSDHGVAINGVGWMDVGTVGQCFECALGKDLVVMCK